MPKATVLRVDSQMIFLPKVVRDACEVIHDIQHTQEEKKGRKAALSR